MSTVRPASYDALLTAASKPTRDVTLSTGAALPLRGVTIVEVIGVLRAHPSLREVILNVIGAGDADEDPGTSAQLLDAFLDAGPEAIATLISVAAGGGHDKAFRDAILDLGDDDVLSLLASTIELTMPSGAADFFGRFAAVAARLGLLAGRGRPSAEAA